MERKADTRGYDAAFQPWLSDAILANNNCAYLLFGDACSVSGIMIMTNPRTTNQPNNKLHRLTNQPTAPAGSGTGAKKSYKLDAGRYLQQMVKHKGQAGSVLEASLEALAAVRRQDEGEVDVVGAAGRGR